MKIKRYSIIGLIAIVTTGAILSAPLSLQAQQQSSQRFSPVYSPEIPSKVKLCGKDIDLDRNDMYERFDRELTSLVYSHGSTMLTLKRANKYFPIIAPILKANGVPLDMLYLVCTESTLNPRAYSPAKAAGLWQFVPSTAKQYGLEVNDEIDERYDVVKSTKAACRYLKDAYAKYGDWPTVMASYNAGMGRISKELEAQMADNSFDLYLNDETSRYVFRIMAIKAIVENPAAYGYILNANQLYRPVNCREVTVSTPVKDWAEWAKSQGISYAQLKEENPWIRNRALTNKNAKTYTVRIPDSASTLRSNQKNSVYNDNWVKSQAPQKGSK